jgi:hypothetical protein
VACDRLGQALALAAWYEQWEREPAAWAVDALPRATLVGDSGTSPGVGNATGNVAIGN